VGIPPGLARIAASNTFRRLYWGRVPRGILRIQFCDLGFPCASSSADGPLLVRLGTHTRSFVVCAASPTAGNVKHLLPPRQSRGISFVSLGEARGTCYELEEIKLHVLMGLDALPEPS
jgi:hypothetical protein